MPDEVNAEHSDVTQENTSATAPEVPCAHSEATHSTIQSGNAAPRRIARLIARSEKPPIFTAEDAKAMFQHTRCQPPAGTDFDKLATKFELIAQGCFSSYYERTAPTPGKDQERSLWKKRLAAELRAEYGLNGPLDHLTNENTTNAVYVLALRLHADEGPGLYLRQQMAAEIGAPMEPSISQAIRLALRALQYLELCEEQAADAAETEGAQREAPAEEIYLVAALHKLRRAVTGEKGWYRTTLKGEKGGPFIRFVMAVAAHIHARRHVEEPDLPAELAKNLAALSRSPRRVISRTGPAKKALQDTNLPWFTEQTCPLVTAE